MPFPIRNYARALYESAEGKTKAEVGELVARTLAVMKEKGVISKSVALMAEIERLDDSTAGRIHARVESAHRLDDATMDTLEKSLLHRSGAKEIVWDKHIDKTLLGGARIRYGDTVLDMSLASRVQSLKESITN